MERGGGWWPERDRVGAWATPPHRSVVAVSMISPKNGVRDESDEKDRTGYGHPLHHHLRHLDPGAVPLLPLPAERPRQVHGRYRRRLAGVTRRAPGSYARDRGYRLRRGAL